MPPKQIILQHLFFSIYLLIGVIIPGSSFLLVNKNKWAFAVPLLGVMWVALLSWSRWVITPTGFAVMLAGLGLLHIASYALGWYLKPKAVTPNVKHGLALVALFMLNTSIALGSHLYKDPWFGFAFYHIPSDSMSPALETGDVVMVDTWQYRHNEAQQNDIVIIQRTASSMVLAKRITNIRKQEGKTELFIEGDNPHRSVDSRRFGWVADDFLIGKVRFVWFSFKDLERFLETVKQSS
jgi:type IV secretory pathway protease TraF